MLKLIVSFFIFLFFIFSIQSQEIVNIDNNTHILKAKALTDSQWKYYQLGDYKNFKLYTDSILSHAKKHNLKTYEIDAIIRLGVYYQKIDEYDTSMNYYSKAFELSKNIPENYKKRTIILINLGNLQNIIGYHDKARTAFEEAQHYINEFNGPDVYKMAVYTGLSESFSANKDFKTALLYLEKAKHIGEKLKRDDIIINALNSMAENYLLLNEFDQALIHSKKAESLYTKEQSIERRSLSLYLIGASLVGLNRFDEAAKPLQMAQGISFTNDFLKIQMNTHKQLAKVFEAQGNLEKANMQQKGYINTQKKYLSSLSKAKRLQAEQSLKNTEKRLKEESIFKWSSIILGILIVIALISILLVIVKKKRQAELQATQLKENQILLQDENEVLKTKILKLVQQKSSKTKTNSTKLGAKKSILNQEEKNKYVQKILDYMEKEQPFLDHEIKQLDIAKNLNMSTHLFSEILNSCFQRNFNTFINLYRVDKAKQLIKNPAYSHYKILAIGYESGFASKTSFNRLFKQSVGQTPSEYRQKHLELINA